MKLLNAFAILASVGICCANSILLTRSSLAQRGSYGEYTGYCEFNGKAERCFIKEWGVGIHKVTWLSDGVQAIYAETNQGSYVEQNGVRYPAKVTGGCTLPTNGCRIWFKTQNGTTVLPALHAR